ncbi:MAG: hypothetical protein ABI454_08600 [Sphingomicrobium sp.]
MIRLALPILLMAAAPGLAQERTPASLQARPQALQLFERDWVLMNWALKFFDRDRDVLLSPAEAGAAADEFRGLADSNRDGRVTPEEYNAARASILARY